MFKLYEWMSVWISSTEKRMSSQAREAGGATGHWVSFMSCKEVLYGQYSRMILIVRESLRQRTVCCEHAVFLTEVSLRYKVTCLHMSS